MTDQNLLRFTGVTTSGAMRVRVAWDQRVKTEQRLNLISTGVQGFLEHTASLASV